jgi:hypothetical protein
MSDQKLLNILNIILFVCRILKLITSLETTLSVTTLSVPESSVPVVDSEEAQAITSQIETYLAEFTVEKPTYDTIENIVIKLKKLTSDVALFGYYIPHHDERVTRLIFLIYILNKIYTGEPFFTDKQLTKLLD